jgi:hypothetical protein
MLDALIIDIAIWYCETGSRTVLSILHDALVDALYIRAAARVRACLDHRCLGRCHVAALIAEGGIRLANGRSQPGMSHGGRPGI